MNVKQEAVERLRRLIEEGRIFIPSRFPIEELFSWKPESDASLALRYVLQSLEEEQNE